MLMTTGELERLSVLQAEEGNENQLRVSPRQGWLLSRASIVLARSTESGSVYPSYFLDRLRIPYSDMCVVPFLKMQFDFRCVFIVCHIQYDREHYVP